MRIVFSCLAIVGITIVVSAQQTVSAPTTHNVDATPSEAVLEAKQMEVGMVSEPQVLRDGGLAVRSRVVGKGVEIRIGSALITADEAEIRYGAPGKRSDVQLRGNVHLKAILEVK
jgi:hypothetical protein